MEQAPQQEVPMAKFLLVFACQFITLFSVFAGGSGNPKAVKADQEIHTKRKENILSKIELLDLPVTKLYWARILLEKGEYWDVAFEILRSLYKDEDTLNETARKKIKKAYRIVGFHVPLKKGWRSFTDGGQHMVRAYFEAQYLINEAIMDMRIIYNKSSTDETKFVKELIQNYFFPGMEDKGEVIYPKRVSYQYDFYALNKKNLEEALIYRADRNPKRTGFSRLFARSSLSYLDGIGQVYDDPFDDFDDFDPNNPPTENPVSSPNNISPSFVDGMIGARSLEDDYSGYSSYQTKFIIRRMIDFVLNIKRELGVSDRIYNRDLEQALLTQAIVEPSSVVLDPQLRMFMEGVKIKFPLLADLGEEEVKESFGEMQKLLGQEGQFQKVSEGLWRLDIKSFSQNERAHRKSHLQLVLEENGDKEKAGRYTLMVISGVSGADLMVTRWLQSLALFIRDYRRIGTTKNWLLKTSVGSMVIKSPTKFLLLTFDFFIEGLARIEMWAKSEGKAVRNGFFVRTVGYAAWFFKSVFTTNRWIKKSKFFSSLLTGVKSNRVVKFLGRTGRSGSLLSVVTGVALLSELAVGAVEYNNAGLAEQKEEVLINTLARSSATVSYLAPYWGWLMMGLDLSQSFTAQPYESGDVFKKFISVAQNIHYKKLARKNKEADLNRVTVYLKEWENLYGLPMQDQQFNTIIKDVESAGEQEEAMAEITQSMSESSLAYLSIIYRAHHSFVWRGHYRYGVYLEKMRSDFNRSKYYFLEARNKLITTPLKAEDLGADPFEEE